MRDYNNKEFVEYFNDLATGYDYAGVYDEVEFAGMLMRHHEAPEEVAYEIVSEIPQVIADYLINPSLDNSDKLLEAIKLQAVKYYQDKMSDMLSQHSDDVMRDANEDAGLESYIDPINGELRWRKK